MSMHPQAVNTCVQGLAMVGVDLQADVVHRDVIGQGKCLYRALLEVERKLSQSSVRGSMGMLYLSQCKVASWQSVNLRCYRAPHSSSGLPRAPLPGWQCQPRGETDHNLSNPEVL
jgi:hypothetical protein